MNEKLQYATMLEMPVNTCNVTKVSSKKKRLIKKKKPTEEQVKNQLLDMVNNQPEQPLYSSDYEQEQLDQDDNGLLEESQDIDQQTILGQEQDQAFDRTVTASVSNQSEHTETNKKTFKITAIGVQLAVIGLLIATILLTNAIFVDSGINVFLRNIFSSEQQVEVDNRVYSQFTPIISMGNNQDLTLDDGYISFAGEGSVYAPCDGKVVSVTKSQEGYYDVEIMHSENFKSIISGIEHVFVEQGQSVYKTIPVGHLEANGAKLCFADSDGSIITDYQIDNGTVKWAV
ncbi:MAG: M23 family metallopeptidase [Clostridiales bacterium]|nr:M23 family metallopeptidase [Clostridiales bacterium]